jgi:hypothetical protein
VRLALASHQYTRHAVAAVLIGAAHVGAGDFGNGLAADDVIVLRLGSAITSGHQQITALNGDAFSNADDEVTRHRAVEVVGVGVVVIVPALEHAGHVLVTFNVTHLHAVELFVFLVAPFAHLVEVGKDRATQDFGAFSTRRKLRPAA